MATVGDALYYILLPFAWILESLIWLLRIILSPVLLVFRVIFNTGALPFRFIAKFEALSYYFGVATCCGIGIGVIAHFVGRGILQVLNLDDDDDVQDVGEARSWSEMSRKRRRRREEKLLSRPLSATMLKLPPSDYALRPQLDRMTPKSPSALMATPILEEDDSSEDS